MADSFQSGRNKLRERLLGLPRGQKRSLQIASDVLLIWSSLWLSLFIRHGNPIIVQPFTEHGWLFLTAPAIAVPLFLYCGLYKAVMRYIGSQVFTKIIMAVTASAALL